MNRITVTSYPIEDELVCEYPSLIDCFRGMSAEVRMEMRIYWMYREGSLQVEIWNDNDMALGTITAYLDMNRYQYTLNRSVAHEEPKGDYLYRLIPTRNETDDSELPPNQLYAVLSYLKRAKSIMLLKLEWSGGVLTCQAACLSNNDILPWELVATYQFNPNLLRGNSPGKPIGQNMGRKLMSIPVAYPNFKNLIYGYNGNTTLFTNKGITVGRLINNLQGESLTIQPKAFSYMSAIWGVPGGGKTVLSLSLIIQLWNTYQIPSLIIEPSKHEYRALANALCNPDGSQLQLRVIRNFRHFNILVPPKGMDMLEWGEVVLMLISMSTQISYDSALPGYYRAAYMMTAPQPTPRRMRNAFKEVMKQQGFQGNQGKDFVQAGLARLVAFFTYFYGDSSQWDVPPEDLLPFNIADYLCEPTIIELASITTPRMKATYVYFLLQHIYAHIQTSQSETDRVRYLLILEEAHNILRKNANEEVLNNVANILAEARALGLGVLISDQSPKNLHPACVSMAQNVFAFKIVDREDRDIIAQTTDGNAEKLLDMPRGQCLVRTHFMHENDYVAVTSQFIEQITAPVDKNHIKIL